MGPIFEGRTKLFVTKWIKYIAVTLTTLLYALCISRMARVQSTCQTTQLHLHSKCFLKMLGIEWQGMLPETEVIMRAGIRIIHTLLQKSINLRLFVGTVEPLLYDHPQNHIGVVV